MSLIRLLGDQAESKAVRANQAPSCGRTRTGVTDIAFGFPPQGDPALDPADQHGTSEYPVGLGRAVERTHRPEPDHPAGILNGLPAAGGAQLGVIEQIRGHAK